MASVDVYLQNYKSVATWLAHKDLELLKQQAKAHNISTAAYIRAIIVDALQDEQLYSSNLSANSKAV